MLKYFQIVRSLLSPLGLLAVCVLGAFVSADARPNVILILTDDQGTGDLSCHGNPWIKTRNIDSFYKESVRMTDFHVSRVCTPTRGAIMTGRYPINNGAWATYKGRDALSEDNLTMAEIFQQNGDRTGLFGVWHLGPDIGPEKECSLPDCHTLGAPYCREYPIPSFDSSSRLQSV